MPQMSPLWWTSLFLMFLILFLSTNMINYFIFLPTLKKKFNSKVSMKFLTWKW